jgi:hypothetical protein
MSKLLAAAVAYGPQLLSKRAGAKFLGIGRCGTLESLIRRGVISIVIVDGREFLSRAQLEEFARVGEAPTTRAARKPKKRAGGSIANIPVLP